MKSLIKNLIFIVILAVTAYAGYNIFLAGDSSSLDVGMNESEGQILGREFLVRLGELEKINFSRELLDDPRFRSLSSFSTSPDPVTAGRPDPFLP
ncbi:MAG: hypothetical protein WDZ56_01670 [Candidatus Paceibacterota bacterium]